MFDLVVSELLNGNKVSIAIDERSRVRFSKIEMLAPNKVMRFTFNKGGVVKTVCKDDDVFTVESACYIALAKLLSYGRLTPDGISAFAEELRYYKEANKIVEAGLKLYNRSVKEKEKAIAAEKEAKLIKERQRAKKIRYKERKRAKVQNR